MPAVEDRLFLTFVVTVVSVRSLSLPRPLVVQLEENAPSLQAALKMYYKYSVKMLPGGHVDTTDADKMRMLFAPIVSLMKQDAPQQQQARERRGGASHKRGARHQSPQYAKTHK